MDSHKAEMPFNHWVLKTREVQDAAKEYEIEREQEFKDLITKQQDSGPTHTEEHLLNIDGANRPGMDT